MPATACEVKVLAHEAPAEHIRLMTPSWPRRDKAPRAGQFFMLRCWPIDAAPLLSRPISLHSYDPLTGTVQFLYEIKGPGTRMLAALRPGDSLSLTGPSGNGFPVEHIRGRVDTDIWKVSPHLGEGIGEQSVKALALRLVEISNAGLHYNIGAVLNFLKAPRMDITLPTLSVFGTDINREECNERSCGSGCITEFFGFGSCRVSFIADELHIESAGREVRIGDNFTFGSVKVKENVGIKHC